MFCTKCGNQLADDAKFCTKCGTPVAAKKEEKKEEQPKEEPKAEETKVEEPKEEPKAEEKKEEPKVEEPKAEEKKEEPKVEEPKVELKKEEPKEEPKAEVKEEVASAVEESPTLKKGNTSGAKVAIIAGVSVVAVVAIGLVLWLAVFKNMIAMNNFKKALEEDDYREAKKIVRDTLEDSSKEDKATELLVAEIEEVKEKYKSGDIDIDELMESLDDIESVDLDVEDELEEARKWVNKINESILQFKAGKESYESEYYTGAIDCLKNVIKDDKNYKEAQELIEKCYDEIVADAIENATQYVGWNDYKGAIEVLDTAKETVGDDNKILEDAYAELEKKIVEKVAEEVEENNSYGWYSSSLSYVENALELFPENEDLKAQKDEISKSKAADDFENINSSIEYYTGREEQLCQAVSEYFENADEAYITAFGEKAKDLIDTYNTKLEEGIKNNNIKQIYWSIKFLSTICPDNEEYTNQMEKYAEYSEFVDILNTSYETEKGEASRADYTTNDMELSFSWWSDEGVAGRINIPVEDYKSISGVLTRTDSETDAAKFIVSVGKEVLFTTNLDAKNNNVAFNVEIPEGADTVSVRWTRANKDVIPVIRVSNFVMCKKYLAAEEDTSTEEESQKGETSVEGETQEGETQVEGETQEGGTSVEGETQEGGASAEGETQEGGASAEGETQEGGTSVEGETQEGGTSAEGETQTGDTPVGNETQEGENPVEGEAQSQASAAPTV